MGSTLPTSLSMGWQTARHVLNSAAQAPLYVRIFLASSVFIIAAPLLVGIYESWRKKQITNIHTQDFSKSLNPITLYLIGIRELRNSHWSSSLETMTPSQVRKIQLDKLPQHQLGLLASRKDIVNDFNASELLYLYKKITNNKKEFVSSLNSRRLLELLNLEYCTPDPEFGTFDLEAISPSDAWRIPLKKLSKHQLGVLASRAAIVNELSPDQLLKLYEKITNGKKDFVTNLSAGQLRALLNHKSFHPGEEFTPIFESILDSRNDLRLGPSKLRTMLPSEACGISLERLSLYQLNILVKRAVLVNQLNPDQILYLYENATIDKKEFINNLKSHKVLAILTHQPFHPESFYNFCAERTDVIDELTPDQLLYLYQKIRKKEEFITRLTSRRLLDLLNANPITLDEKIAIFEFVLSRQIDLVEILAHLHAAYSLLLCSVFSQSKKYYTNVKPDSIWGYEMGQNHAIEKAITDLISKIKTKHASIPTALTDHYLSEVLLNQFSLLFLSADQLHSINFKKAQFAKIECIDIGSSSQLLMNISTPSIWLESVCALFDEAFEGKRLQIREIKTQLQQLSTKQVAFLDRRTERMSNRNDVFRNVFSIQLKDPHFSDYLLEFDNADSDTDSQTVTLPSLTMSEAYKILELENGVSLDAVKAKYKKMALIHHPDKTIYNKEEAIKVFQKISEAYAFLVRMLSL